MIKKSKITAAVMAAILAVTTIFSPVLAGEFSSPEEISEEFSENEKIVEYGTEAFGDAAQVQYDENEETFSTEEGEENNVIVIDNANEEDNNKEKVYVNSETGNNSNIGETPQQPVKTLDQAFDNVKDGGTIILLSDCKQSYAGLKKTVTIKSENKDEPKTLTGGGLWKINENKTVTFENLVIQNLEIQSNDNIKNAGSVVFNNVRNASVGGTHKLEAVVLNNSEITCPYLESSKVEMNDSTLNGRFMTDELIVNGENNILQYTKKNALGRIDRIATVNGKLVIKLYDADEESIRGEKVLQVPDTLTSLANIELDSSYGEQYELKIRKYYNGNYMYISEGIDPQIDLYVGNEPRDKEKVDISSGENISVNAKMTNFSGAHMSVVGNWSGYSGGGIPFGLAVMSLY